MFTALNSLAVFLFGSVLILVMVALGAVLMMGLVLRIASALLVPVVWTLLLPLAGKAIGRSATAVLVVTSKLRLTPWKPPVIRSIRCNIPLELVLRVRPLLLALFRAPRNFHSASLVSHQRPADDVVVTSGRHAHGAMRAVDAHGDNPFPRSSPQ